jgi:hypothetical protein
MICRIVVVVLRATTRCILYESLSLTVRSVCAKASENHPNYNVSTAIIRSKNLFQGQD